MQSLLGHKTRRSPLQQVRNKAIEGQELKRFGAKRQK